VSFHSAAALKLPGKRSSSSFNFKAAVVKARENATQLSVPEESSLGGGSSLDKKSESDDVSTPAAARADNTTRSRPGGHLDSSEKTNITSGMPRALTTHPTPTPTPGNTSRTGSLLTPARRGTLKKVHIAPHDDSIAEDNNNKIPLPTTPPLPFSLNNHLSNNSSDIPTAARAASTKRPLPRRRGSLETALGSAGGGGVNFGHKENPKFATKTKDDLEVR
jgi:hypothetical protein